MGVVVERVVEGGAGVLRGVDVESVVLQVI